MEASLICFAQAEIHMSFGDLGYPRSHKTPRACDCHTAFMSPDFEGWGLPNPSSYTKLECVKMRRAAPNLTGG